MSWVRRVREALHTDVRELVAGATAPQTPVAKSAADDADYELGSSPTAPGPPSDHPPVIDLSLEVRTEAADTTPADDGGVATWSQLLRTPVGELVRPGRNGGTGTALPTDTATEVSPAAFPLAQLRAGDCVADAYEVRRVLRRNSISATYLARHLAWNADVVLRVPIAAEGGSPPSVRATADLVAPWTALGLHPHIAYCHYVHPIEGAPVVVIEHVDGHDLRDWLDSGRNHSLRASLNVAIQVCHALEHMHDAGVAHGGLEPANVLIAPDGTVKVTDLRLDGWDVPAAPRGDAEGAASSPAARTAAYVAPEQWTGTRPDTRSDVFALGTCLYEILCGAPPYDATHGPEREAPEPRGVGETPLPEALCDLLRECVDWDCERRPMVTDVRRRLCEIYAARIGKPSPFTEAAATPSEADGWSNRGVASSMFHQHDDAIAAWDAALGIDLQHLEATYNRGVALWRLGRATDEEVIQQLARARPGATEWKAQYLRALVHLESGQAEEAAELLRQAADANPEHAGITAAVEILGGDVSRARLLRGFQAHGGNVSAACFSPEGRYLYSGGADQSVRLWEIETGRCLRSFDGHTGNVAAVDVTVNGRTLLTAGDDGALRMWDTKTGRSLRVVDLGAERVFSASIAGDGRHAACAFSGAAYGALGTGIELWDLTAKRKKGHLAGHTAAAKVVSLSADGKWAVTGGDDKTVRLWDVATMRQVRLFQGHFHFVSAVAISHDAQWIASGSWDKSIRLWDLASGRCLRSLIGHSGLVSSVRISRNGQWILSGGWDGTVRLWEASSGRCLRTFTGHGSLVSTVAFSTDGAMAASGSWDRTIRLYQVPEKPVLVCSPQLPESWRYDAAAARKGVGQESIEEVLGQVRLALDEGSDATALELLRRCRADGGKRDADEIADETRRLWRQLSRVLPRADLRDVHMERTFTVPDAVLSGDLTADAGRVVTGGRDGTLRTWDTATGECVTTFAGHTDRVLSVVLRPDGGQMLSASADRTVRLWDLVTGETLRLLAGHESVVSAACFTPGGHRAISAGGDHTVRVWNLDDGTCLRELTGHTRQVTSVAVTIDGLKIVSSAHDHTVRVWEARSGRCLRVLEGHPNPVTSVSVSPDGGWALSGSQDRTVRLWDLRNGRCLRVLEGHADTVSAVLFSPDGRWAFSASWDRTIRIWDLASGRCWGLVEGYRDRITSLRQSADGLWLLSGCADATARLWELDWELESPAGG